MNFKLNNVKIAGRISRNISINTTAKSAKQVGNIAVAITVSGERTLFVKVTAWSEVADIIPKLQKGDLVYVEGRLDLEYKNDDKIIISAEKIRLLHSKLHDKLGKTSKDVEELFAMHELEELYSGRSN